MSLVAAMEVAVAEVEASAAEALPPPPPPPHHDDGLCSSSSDSSSSDSEQEAEPSHGQHPGHNIGDEDEEIEYGDGYQSRPPPHTRQSKASTVSSKPLVSPFGKPPSPSTSATGTGKASGAPAPSQQNIDNVPSAFGIAYKPMRAPQAPEPFSSEQQRDRELDLLLQEAAADGSASTTASSIFKIAGAQGAPAHDDFDDDFAAPAVDVTLLLQQAQQLRAQEAPPTLPRAVLASPPEAPHDSITALAPTGGEPEAAGEGVGWREEAEAALNLLTDTYSRGFGDIEVRAMDQEEAPHVPATLPTTTGKLSELTIAEEDEEEAARREEEEEQAAERKRAEEEQAVANLAQEWDSLAPPTSRSKRADQGSAADDGGKITYDEVMRHFREKYPDPSSSGVAGGEVSPKKKAGMAWLLMGGGSSASSLGAEESKERDLLLAITEEHFDPSDPVHYRLIRRLYTGLTGRSNCPMTGSHWEAVGFQGTDPRTDLNRSMGVFSLIQALYFMEANAALVRALFQQSQDEVAHWPFLLVSINFTRDAVQALRDGTANKEFKKRSSIAAVVHGIHQALFFDFHLQLAAQPGVHHTVHLSAVRARATKDIMALEKTYQDRVKKGGAVAVINVDKAKAGDAFTVLEDAQEADTKEVAGASSGSLSVAGKKHLVQSKARS